MVDGLEQKNHSQYSGHCVTNDHTDEGRVAAAAHNDCLWDRVEARKVGSESRDVRMALGQELSARVLDGRVSTKEIATLLTLSLQRHNSTSAGQLFRASDTSGTITIECVLDFIEEHLSENLCLARVAGMVHFSQYHFARLFRKTVGVSPHQYVIRRRVERTKLLLLATDWTLAAIAPEVGFASGSHLALQFKRVTGTSPKHYRRYHTNVTEPESRLEKRPEAHYPIDRD